MWVLPPDLARLKVALPEGLLLLPHHYTATDRERLLALLRALMPECGQTLIEAGSLTSLAARGLTLPDGIVLVYGFSAEEEVEGLRARVAPLGARHLLVQLPRPQLTGTGWIEPTLKVPLLRAIEGAWRNPQHPLRALGIQHLAVREAARCTDDVVELLTILQDAVEHRLRNVGAGVAAEDWGRSLDHALATRLLARMAGPLPWVAASLARGEGASNGTESEVDALAERGLVVRTSTGPRRAPLLHALTRPGTATRALLNIRSETDIGRDSARELFHMALELDPFEAQFVAWDSTWLRGTGLDPLPSVYRFSLRDPHRWLLDPTRDEAISGAVLWLQNKASSSGGSERASLLALATYFRCLITRGASHHAELIAAVDEVRHADLDANLSKKIPALTALVVAFRVFSERSTAADCDRVATLLRMIDTGHEGLTKSAKHALWVLSTAFHGPTSREMEDISSEIGEIWAANPPSVGPLNAMRITRRGTLTINALHRELVKGTVALASGHLDGAIARGRNVLDLAVVHELPVLRAFARELMASVHELRGAYDEAVQLLLRARSRYIALADSARIAGVERRLTRMGIAFEPARSSA